MPEEPATLETEAPDSLALYQSDPTPQNLRTVVDGLRPTIDYSLISMGLQGDPVMQNQAKLFAAGAVRKYDPTHGTSLKTHVSNQLKQMHRFARKAQQPVRVPERDQWTQHALHRAEQEFIESKGREPSTLELSEWSTIPLKKIEHVRRIPHARSEGQAAGPDPSNPHDLGEEGVDYFAEAMDYVYRGLPARDQKIFEHMTGFGGAAELTPAEISHKLGVSQSLVSRKFAAMMLELQDLETQLQRVAS